MSARDDVVAAAEALRGHIPLLKTQWPEERWSQFQAELLDWLGDFERCRREEDWLVAWNRLLEVAAPHELLDVVESAWMHAPVIPDVAEPLTGPVRNDNRQSVPPRSVSELVEWLRDILEPVIGTPAKPLEAYPEVRVEGHVFEQQPFRLEVLVRAEPTTGANHKAILSRSRGGSADLYVVLSLPHDGSITSRSPLDQPLHITEGRDSDRVIFELFAVRPGRHRLGVRFRQSGVTRAESTLPVLVLAAHEWPSPSSVSTEVSASFQVGNGCAPSLVLELELRGMSNGCRFLRVTLIDHTARLHEKEIAEVDEESLQRMVASCVRLGEELARRHAEAQEDFLRGVGAEMAASMLPKKIYEGLESDRHSKETSLHIESRAIWLPWELFFVGPPDRGWFLGDRFPVTRWHSHAQHRSHLDGNHAVLVAPRDSGLNVERERRALERLTGAPVEELRTLSDFQQRMRRGPPIGFLHFACHGTAASASHPSPATSTLRDVVPDFADLGHPLLLSPRGVLLLEKQEPLQSSDIPRYPGGAPTPLKGAFIFLNACHAGFPSNGPWGHESWVKTFFEAGAIALIAPSWTVSDKYAGAFSESVYERLAAGETLGKAAQWARGQLPSHGVADRLGYAVYAFPETRRSPPPTSHGKDIP